MKLVTRQQQSSELLLPDERELEGLLAMSGKLLMVSFRGTKIRVLAQQCPDGQRERSDAPVPVTDPVQLELLTGVGEAPDWPRPVSLKAIVERRSDPVLAVQQASRWASYGARVAVTPMAGLNEQALLEARLRGVWLVAAGGPRRFDVAVTGEPGPTSGSSRGLAHRLLDELIWERLSAQHQS